MQPRGRLWCLKNIFTENILHNRGSAGNILNNGDCSVTVFELLRLFYKGGFCFNKIMEL